jgi:putative DNA primase/helicase
MADNIFKLADLQDAGELPASTEDALALAYAERHAADSRYVAAWSRWLLYNGARWIFDTTLHAFDRARAIGKSRPTRQALPPWAARTASPRVVQLRSRRSPASPPRPSNGT